jgi:hypothetical protein
MVTHNDRHASKPTWMADFVDTGENLAGGWELSLWAKNYPTGTVSLGDNVEDDLSNNSTYTVIMKFGSRPMAQAGLDQTVTNTDGNRTELITLNGGGNSDSDDNIISYDWQKMVNWGMIHLTLVASKCS